jgi:pimeloyl-ACP methyl ester carboxylesterase
MCSDIRPFVLRISDTALEDLQRRIASVRWSDRELVPDLSQGLPIAHLQDLCEFWKNSYDWRRCEAWLNGVGQYSTSIDGLDIHFLHVRSAYANALPILLTHGWPGSILEFRKVIGPLTNPVRESDEPVTAFHVVIPALPGFGFSGKPVEPGWNVPRIARAWAMLMQRLGYDFFVAQGGDWGSVVTTAMARLGTPALKAIHINMVLAPPSDQDLRHATTVERVSIASANRYFENGMGYATLQRTRPQTIGYSLADSPVGQAAWIFEKLIEWSDCDADPWSIFTREEILDNIMLYWLPNAGTSSARLYWESSAEFHQQPIESPVAVTIFPKEIVRPSRSWAERVFKNIIYWNEAEKGGHFAALEQPALFVREVRNAFRQFRPG